ncbi:MAG: N-acetylmuramoyl-L-alanine amidase [Desulfobulbus sp.]|nr:N-acetylmuramoyl-L-alanine amidase [Desulfobulbus sp.]
MAKLLTSKPSNAQRSNWLILANAFRELYLQTKGSEIGPSCLFMQARVFHLMHIRSHHGEDAESARRIYLELADLYPGHPLSDDALYKAASLTSVVEKKTPSAESLYQQIINQYPKGDFLSKAQQQLQKQQPTPSKVEAPVLDQTPNGAALTKEDQRESFLLPQIGPSKFWSSAQYSRVVISASSIIPYAIKQENDSILVDLQRSSIEPKLCGVQQFSDGLLQEVSTSKTENDVVRIQLHLHPFSEYKAFILKDPFRLVVDIYGEENTPPVPPALPAQNKNIVPENKATGTIAVLTDHKKRAVTSSSPHIKMQREHLSLAQQLGLGVKTIVIDPGHGGKDPGAMAFGMKEKDIVLGVSKKLAKVLTETFHYQVVLTRTKDVYIPLEKRTAIANAKKADLFVSIHVNAHPNQANSGIETYFLNLATDSDAMRVAALENASSTHSIGELQDILSSLMNNSKIDESSRLARFVQTTLINGFTATYKPRDLGVKQAPFYVLIGAEMPAILAEISFITNPKEAQLLKNNAHLDIIALQLAGGIVAYIDHHRAAVRF